MRSIATAVVLFVVGIICLQPASPQRFPMSWDPIGGASPPTLDGSATNIGSTASLTTSLTTSKTNDEIVVFVAANGCTSSVDTLTVTATTPSSLTFSQRSSNNITGSTNCAGNSIFEFTALSSGALASESIVAAVSPGSGVNFMESCVFGVNGAKTSSPFDANASLPDPVGSSVGGSTMSLSTSHAADFIYGGFRNWVSVDAGWTKITSGSFIGCEYIRETATQTGLSPLAGGANLSGTNGAIGDAMVSP